MSNELQPQRHGWLALSEQLSMLLGAPLAPSPCQGISAGCQMFLPLKFLAKRYSDRDLFFRSAVPEICTVASVFLAQWF